MNRILAYTVIAILLGTVTMVVPLAVLEPNGSIPLIQGSDEPSNQEGTYEVKGTTENGNFSAQLGVTEPASGSNETDWLPESSRQDSKLVPTFTLISADASPIVFMTLPSFLVALGVFVYLRKRTM